MACVVLGVVCMLLLAVPTAAVCKYAHLHTIFTHMVLWMLYVMVLMELKKGSKGFEGRNITCYFRY